MQSGRSYRRCLAGLALGLASLGSAAQEPALYVYSTIDALLAGVYDGELTVAQLGTRGNFGIGTYNHLDGEMVVHDGKFYHVRSDGSVRVAAPSERTPLAYVLPFVPTQTVALGPSASLAQIEALADQQLGNKNMFYALEIKGQFSAISTRAIPPQTRPYRPLAEVSKSQNVFSRDTVTGTMIGIRSPALSKGISVPGYHWHFISDDLSFGGHVLGTGLARGVLRLVQVRRMEVELPLNEDFAKADQEKDRAAELRKVESARHDKDGDNKP
ncbi:acetolactate decarboxylase [Massilia antarctica]|uniref:Alpha-acetolactate decarboxylase n=1 Tax=Massilia antarctica TaxID=2765360 RepID=A0AA49A9L3_9BURK|nr:acetolactate decarboxylase [Massilia antarctica]QPI50897.1 acetolactate decarboxylase [Massilia antarctica]